MTLCPITFKKIRGETSFFNKGKGTECHFLTNMRGEMSVSKIGGIECHFAKPQKMLI